MKNLFNNKKIKDVLLAIKPDRRLLSKVPDEEGLRVNKERRGFDSSNGAYDIKTLMDQEHSGTRYLIDYDVAVQYFNADRKKMYCQAVGKDISSTGMLLEIAAADAETLDRAKAMELSFEIIEGTMPEGYEMSVNIGAEVVRWQEGEDGKILCGVRFNETLAQYAGKKKGRYISAVSFALLLMIAAFIILMRSESVIYFKFNKSLYLYSIIAAAFLLTRYLFGALYRTVPIKEDFTPGVTIIIPCFNEEEWINRTILSCINQSYPSEKLEVIIVDDGSTDQSVAKIKETIDSIAETVGEKVRERLFFLVQEQNAGKREALVRGAMAAKHELVVFVDSDSFVDPFAIYNLVQPFQDANMGGVSGRTDVANTYTNVLTKMQAVRYYIAFRIMKAAEGYFDAVTCLSGPLSCYRKELVLQHKEAWLNQKFLGQKATFGDDRSLTNFILREHRTGYQDTAVCSTIVPNTYGMFLKQQMRWKRSWLRESLIAAKFMWKKEPFMALSFYMGLLVPVAAPIVVLYNLVYIPAVYRVFPTTFLVGLLMMALMMSMAQLFLRKSSTWIFGIWFCLYYEAVLLWQMPIAWFTFWKSEWGTRMTPADSAALEKKKSGK
ncbi:MAG: glycosyltransferase [Acidaminococcaceae bacterium]